MLIVFDGLQRTGKSTIIKKVADLLVNKGYPIVTTEWNSIPEIQAIVNKKKIDESFTPYTWFALHFVDFALRYEEVIIPALKNNSIVLCDRYIYTSLTRDYLKGIPIEYLRNIHTYFSKPDWSFFFIADPSTVYERHRNKIGNNKMHKYNSVLDIYKDNSHEYSKFLKYQTELKKLYQNIQSNINNSDLIDTTDLSIEEIYNCIIKRVLILTINRKE